MKRSKILVAMLLLMTMLMPFAGSIASAADPILTMVVPGISDQSTTDPISGIVSLGLPEFEKFLNEQLVGVQIKLVSIPWDGWIQKIEAMSTSGEMDIGFYTNQVAVPDWYMDITPYLEKDATINFDTIKDIWVAPAAHYTVYKTFNYPEAVGKVFGLPMTMAANMMSYDEQLFIDKGITPPAIDASFAELVDLAEQMQDDDIFGAFLRAYWLEWFSLSYDAIHPVSSDTMLLSDLDMDFYVEYIKESPEVLVE